MTVKHGDAEGFGLSWPGKQRARLAARELTCRTLRPCPEQSVNWADTSNLFIVGDNLEALKILQKVYRARIDIIYIDPPYNTGKDFIYQDRFDIAAADYLHATGQTDAQGNRLTSTTETAGRFHTNWLNMMYPRLLLAWNLMAQDGVLVCHIDEHEQAHLAILLSEIFGEENNLGTIVWDKLNPKGDAKRVAAQHEYVLLYARNAKVYTEVNPLRRAKPNAAAMLQKAEAVLRPFRDRPRPLAAGVLNQVNREFWAWLRKQPVSGGEGAYRYIDENGDVYRTVSMAWPNKQEAPPDYFQPLIHPVTGKPCPVPGRGWRNSPRTMAQLLAGGQIVFGPDECRQPERKYLLRENMMENLPSVLRDAGSDDARLKKLGIPFDHPKPVEFVRQLLAAIHSNPRAVVLDFFAGSATTAHAVVAQNQADGGHRSFIMVQLPEPLTGYAADHWAGFANVAEIGIARLRRAFHEVDEELRARPTEHNFDLGFKVFQVADEPAESAVANGVEIIYKEMLDLGIAPSVRVEEYTIAGRAVHVSPDGNLVFCLATEIEGDLLAGMTPLVAALATTERGGVRVIFRDIGFGSDAAKANAILLMQGAGAAEVLCR